MLGMKHGTDMLNGAWDSKLIVDYPNATTQQRVKIRERHIQYILGLLWFWSSDPASGSVLHEEMWRSLAILPTSTWARRASG
jgi:hypothetical protein